MSENWKRWEGEIVDGRYPLLQFLGGGERSAIFLTASEEPSVQKAAIKLVQAEAKEAEAQLERWEEASRLRHPNLLRLFQPGRCQLGGTWLIYLVMECADEDLAQVLLQRPLSVDEMREALAPTLDALAYLHARGYVLTSLRPANILAVGDQLRLASEHVRREGEALASSDRDRTEGSSPYDAPELARGVLSPAADVWSLGVTIVAALTQHLPAWDLAKSVDPSLPPGLPEPFGEIVRHTLQREPAWRWSVAQIQARLGHAVTPAAVPAAAKRPAAKTQADRVPWSIIIGLSVIAILIAIWVFTPHSGRQPAAPAPAQVEQAQPEPPRKAEPAPEQAARKASARASSAHQEPVRKVAPPAAAPVPPPRQAPAAPSATDAHAPSTPGEVIDKVLPEVLPAARESIQGSVKLGVKVRVDESGKVVEATPSPAGPSKYFIKVSLEAARRWKFRPPRVGDQNRPSEWLLHFDFERSGTSVKPEQLAP